MKSLCRPVFAVVVSLTAFTIAGRPVTRRAAGVSLSLTFDCDPDA
jgi:hypothetical protein